MEKSLHSPKTNISKFSGNQGCGTGIKDRHICMSIANRSPEAQVLIGSPTFNLNSTKYPQATGPQSVTTKTLVLSHMDPSMVSSSHSETERQDQADEPWLRHGDKYDQLPVPGHSLSRLTHTYPPPPPSLCTQFPSQNLAKGYQIFHP